jgi:ankyrin repeat protein
VPATEDSLWYAAWTGNRDAVARLLRDGADPDETGSDKSEFDRTPLMEVVNEPEEFFGEDEQAIAEALLGRGADVHRVDGDGWAALHYAVRAGTRAVRLLLDAGADPNQAATDGATPLHQAVSCGSPTVVRLLLEAGALPEVAAADGRTPVSAAADEVRALPDEETEEVLRLLQAATAPPA